MTKRRWLVLFFITSLAGVITLLTRWWNPEPSAKSVSQSPLSQRQFRFSYDVKVKTIPPGSRLIKVWLPIPPSNLHQVVSDLKVTAPLTYAIYQEREYDNQILRLEADGKVPESLLVNVSFKLRRKAYSAWSETGVASADISEETLRRYLLPDRLIPITGQIKEEAEKVVTGEMTDLQKAKSIYDYVSENMSYGKSGIGWGRGDAVYACNSWQGNCTDFHSLFIGMARAVGVPARFVMGFPVPQDKNQGEVSGYHCWAEFYVRGMGWIPVDASEASKYPELREYYFGNLDPDRVEFTIGRDIRLDPALEPQNFFIFPVVLVDTVIYADVQTLFRFSSN